MKVTRIETDIYRANELLSSGWNLQDHELAVSAGGMNGQGLSSYGIENVSEKMRIEARTFVLTLYPAKKCDYYYCKGGCSSCNETGFILDTEAQEHFEAQQTKQKDK